MTTSHSTLRPKAVKFCEQPDIRYIEPTRPARNSRPRTSRLKMAEQIYKKYDAGQVTDSMLQEAAVLFSENYGVWASKHLNS